MKKFTIVFLLLILILLNSCLGASADITLRADGSGKIALEYRVSQMLESMGRLDGNERWPVIPVGKADFERSLARIPDMRLASFSSKDIRKNSGAHDLVTKVTLDFKNTAALLAFLDRSGSYSSLTQNNGKNILRLVLLDPAGGSIDEDLLSLVQDLSSGYEISLSFSVPKNASLSILPSPVPSARVVSQGKKVSCAIPVGDMLSLKDGLALEITW